ncbi:unnamed protein product, partial [Clonostachys rosea]
CLTRHPNLTIFLCPDTILLSRMTLSAEVLRGMNTPPSRFAVQVGSKMGTTFLSAHFYSYSQFRATAASTRAACQPTCISTYFWRLGRDISFQDLGRGLESSSWDQFRNKPALRPTGTAIAGGLPMDAHNT